MIIRYFCSECCVELFPEDAKEAEDLWLNEVEQKNIGMLWCEECQTTSCEVLVFNGVLEKPSCGVCNSSTQLPETERAKWFGADLLCWCKRIPQAVNREDYCSFWEVRPDD